MTDQQTKMTGKLKESLEQAQTRLTALEDETERVLKDLMERGKATQKEIKAALQKVNAQELLEKSSGRAKHVSEDVTRRIEDVRQRAIQVVGVATRDQVKELAEDLDKLSRKLDKLLEQNAKKAAEKSSKRQA
jgi:polyhydroxyalkanoate synthesis regulator phasin